MDKPHRKLSPGATAGITFAAIVGAIIIVTCVKILCRLLRSKNKKEDSHAEIRRSYSLPIRAHGIGVSMQSSDGVENNDHHFHLRLHNIAPFLIWSSRSNELKLSSETKVIEFTYKQLQRATKNFTTLIGKGAFGGVYKAVLSDESVVAVKVLSTNSKQGEKEFQNEVLLLGRLHHRNLLHLIGYCAERGHRLLVYEYMTNGSLDLWLHEKHDPALNWSQRVSVAQDVAKGIDYLHNGAIPPVIHRDIKSSNILLDSYMVARVADFGLSKEGNSGMPASGIKGTYGYVDPEYVSTNSLTYKSDVYSYGVLLFELIVGRGPKAGLLEYVETALVSKEKKQAWLEILDPRLGADCNFAELWALIKIATKCITAEARKRPTMQEVVQAILRLGPRSESFMLDTIERASSIQKGASRDMGEIVITRTASYPERC